MRIVELNRPLAVKRVDARPGREMNAQHVLQRAGNEEILLFEPQDLALSDFVVGVQHLGDVFGLDLVADGPVIIALVERGEIERVDGLRAPNRMRLQVETPKPKMGVSYATPLTTLAGIQRTRKVSCSSR